MERLSSCYFCGTALDEPLGTYLLGSPDPAGSVTLCQTCREKLDTVFDTAGVDAALSEREAPSTPAGSTDGTDADEPSDETADATESESAWEPLDEARGPESEAGEGSAETDDGGESAETDDGVASTEDTAEAPASDDGDAGTTASDDGDSISTDADDILVDLDADDTSDAEDAAIGDSADADAGSRVGSASVDGTGGGGDDATADQDELGDEGGEGGDGVGMEQRESLTRAKFNKVIRLLQNREFPVDREQFVVVASNAYNLRRSECDKVIDVAIDRGILAQDEESGELVRAE